MGNQLFPDSGKGQEEKNRVINAHYPIPSGTGVGKQHRHTGSIKRLPRKAQGMDCIMETGDE